MTVEILRSDFTTILHFDFEIFTLEFWQRVTDEEEEVRAELESVKLEENVGAEGGATCKDVAVSRDKTVGVVYGEQRMEGLALIDLRPQQGPMPDLEDAEDEWN